MRVPEIFADGTINLPLEIEHPPIVPEVAVTLPLIVAFVAINTPLCPTLNTAFVSLAPFLLLLSPAQNANLPVFEDIPVLLGT